MPCGSPDPRQPRHIARAAAAFAITQRSRCSETPRCPTGRYLHHNGSHAEPRATVSRLEIAIYQSLGVIVSSWCAFARSRCRARRCRGCRSIGSTDSGPVVSSAQRLAGGYGHAHPMRRNPREKQAPSITRGLCTVREHPFGPPAPFSGMRRHGKPSAWRGGAITSGGDRSHRPQIS